MSPQTFVMKVSPKAPQKRLILTAAEALRRGGLVAFPTETVYGLGADAFNAEAVKQIFVAKGRPLDNPVIVHIASVADLKALTSHVPERASLLIDRFWPGPLTLILRKSPDVPDDVTGGLDTVAVRMPQNKIALALIKALGHPIAAPSANLSGRPSGTTAGHVLQDFAGKIDMILDGGPVAVGLESTVLDLSRKPPAILRPGAITQEDLEPFLGRVVMGRGADDKKRSPGTRYRHYSPKARVTLVEPGDETAIARLLDQHAKAKRKVAVVARHFTAGGGVRPIVRIMPPDLEEYAQQIFAVFRELDELGVDEIIVEKTEEEGIGVAIMDRLRRAAAR
ncbi:MAG: threonylcarbamoyl-AMP synthase [Dehalococcoidia bacterium]|nr:threonylcarbamoyl-AMP synthase [Dehalococcoidia bacterium]